MRTLIVGYGNRCRKDDGAGWHVIEILAHRPNLPADLEAAHQLDLTLAETIREYDLVIFVDALISDQAAAWSSEELLPALVAQGMTHCVGPQEILGLCRTLYAKTPRGLLFSIRGHDFRFGEGLSQETRQAVFQVVNRIEELVRKGAPDNPYATRADAPGTVSLIQQG